MEMPFSEFVSWMQIINGEVERENKAIKDSQKKGGRG